MLDKIKNWAYSKNVSFWLMVDLICWAILLSILVIAF